MGFASTAWCCKRLHPVSNPCSLCTPPAGDCRVPWDCGAAHEVYARPVASGWRRTHVSKFSHLGGPMSGGDVPVWLLWRSRRNAKQAQNSYWWVSPCKSLQKRANLSSA